MSWEDELGTQRTTTAPSAKQGTTSNRKNDPFESDDESFDVGVRPSSLARANDSSSIVFESDPLSSPLMQAPIYTSEALHASIRTNRELSASQKSLKDSLYQARRNDQSQRILQQQAAGAAIGEVAEDDHEAQELIDRLEKKKQQSGAGGKDDKSSTGSLQPIPALPSLSDIQKELLSVVSQSEPPPRTLQIIPLDQRQAKWMEEGSELSVEELNSRLKLTHAQYLDSRTHARADTRRMWNAQQRLHEMSVKLAAIHSLSDMATLENQLFAQESQNQPTSSADSDAKSNDPTFVDPNSYFYDLYSLDSESYADLKHLHSSSIIDQVDPNGSTGWWRTQLSELDEDWSERRKRDAVLFQQLEEDAVGFIEDDENDDAAGKRETGSIFDRGHGSVPESNGGFLLGRNRAASTTQGELEAQLLANDRRAALAALDGAGGSLGGEQAQQRLTRQQMLARTQGRSFLSLSKGVDVILPPGQRILRPGEKPQGESTEQSKVLDELEEAFREDAQGVKKPQRKYGHH